MKSRLLYITNRVFGEICEGHAQGIQRGVLEACEWKKPGEPSPHISKLIGSMRDFVPIKEPQTFDKFKGEGFVASIPPAKACLIDREGRICSQSVRPFGNPKNILEFIKKEGWDKPAEFVLYIHGFNNNQKNAIDAMIHLSNGEDFDKRYKIGCFDWACSASTPSSIWMKLVTGPIGALTASYAHKYLMDLGSIENDARTLSYLLEGLAEVKTIEKVHVVSHSMGTAITVSALSKMCRRYMLIRGCENSEHKHLAENLRTLLQEKIGKIIFVQSDTDANFMSRFILRFSGFICKLKSDVENKLVFYCRNNDRVLGASSEIRTGKGKYEVFGYRTGISDHLKKALRDTVHPHLEPTDIEKMISVYDTSELSNVTDEMMWTQYSHSYIFSDAQFLKHMMGVIKGETMKDTKEVKNITGIHSYVPKKYIANIGWLGTKYSFQWLGKNIANILPNYKTKTKPHEKR